MCRGETRDRTMPPIDARHGAGIAAVHEHRVGRNRRDPCGASDRASSSRRRGCRVRKRGDSGSSHRSATARPPGQARRRETASRQPKAGSTGIAMRPASVAPTRHAQDRHRDGERTLSDRHVLGRERRGVRDRAAEADASDKTQRRRAPRCCRRGSSAIVVTPKTTMLREQRDATAEAIPCETGDGAANHHADIAKRDDGREVAARHATIRASWSESPRPSAGCRCRRR